MKAWTDLHCDVTHYGSCDDHRRSSVTVYGKGAQLSRWYRGCGFNPETEWFDSLEAAKEAGEAWANGK